MKIHELKTVHPYFYQVLNGIKCFEIRKNDRHYQIGDVLLLKEYFEETDTCTGDYVLADVTYILDDTDYVKEGFVIMGINVLKRHSELPF